MSCNWGRKLDDSNAPRGYFVSETIRNWAIIAGAVFLYFTYGCPAHNYDLQLKSIDNEMRLRQERIAQATEDTQIRLKQLEGKVVESVAALNKVQAEAAQVEMRQQTTPSLLIKPAVEQWPSEDDVRQVRLALEFANAGREPVEVREIALKVFSGRITQNEYGLISQTQDYARAKRIIAQFDGASSIPTSEADRIKWAQSVIERHEKEGECPHGRVLLISKESSHVEWREVVDAGKTRSARHLLAPQDAVTEEFLFILTDAQSPHWQWFRFEVAVNKGTSSERIIEFNLPGFPVQEYYEHKYSGRQELQHAPYRWEPSSPLLPIIDNDDSEERHPQ